MSTQTSAPISSASLGQSLILRLDGRQLCDLKAQMRPDQTILHCPTRQIRLSDATLFLADLSRRTDRPADDDLVLTVRHRRHPISDLRWIESLRRTSSAHYDEQRLEAELLIGPGGVELLVWKGRLLHDAPIEVQVMPPLVDVRTPQVKPADVPVITQYPRTAPLLNNNPQVMRRWLNARVGVGAVGRSGTCLISTLLAQACRRVTLLDGDRVERSNLDGMDLVSRADIDLPKVTAVSKMITRIHPEAEVHTIDLPLGTPESIQALAEVDVIACTVDHASPRLSAGWLAQQLMVPLLDIGTSATGNRRDAFADVRLIVPGDRCLLCMGGINAPQVPRRPGNSPRAINVIATACGVGMLLDYYARPQMRSRWVHIRMNDGLIVSEEVNSEVPMDVPCPWCGRLERH